jgi:predicted phosphodiesterase
MNLWIVSDLHANFGEPMPEPPANADVAVIAGDVMDDVWLVRLASKMRVFFVSGNHEFYGHAYAERRQHLCGVRGLSHLADDTVAHLNVRFIGATLWTDYAGNPLAADLARTSMNDHRVIKWTKQPFQRFLPSHATRLHHTSRQYIKEQLAKSHDWQTIVVTHHAPHERSIHPRFAGQMLNHAYYSDLSDVILDGAPTLWVHGHVHNNFDYTVGATRVLANPRGYPGENPEFNPGLVVTI